MAWFKERVISASTAAAAGELVIVQLPSCAEGVLTVTLPEPGANRHVGVVLQGTPVGGVEVRCVYNGVTLDTLWCDGEAAWFAAKSTSGPTWLVAARSRHRCDFSARFGALGNYELGGAATDPQDTSGNGRHLSRHPSYPAVRRAIGVRMEQSCATFGRGYQRLSEAAFWLTGAMSIEIVCRGNYNVGVSGDLLAYSGVANGNALTNANWSLYFANGGAGSGCFSYRHQRLNNQWMTLNVAAPELYLSYDWMHCVVTRSAASGGNQTINFYGNGELKVPRDSSGNLISYTIAATDGGQATNNLYMYGGGPNLDVQHFAIYGTELSAAKIKHLARLRLGGLR
jgi:hypothetical protein